MRQYQYNQIQILLMHKEQFKLRFLLGVLVTLHFVNQSTSSWIALQRNNTFLPGHIYRISCNRFSTISGSVTWNTGCDLDVKIYRSGTQLLSGNQIRTFESSSNGAQTITYSCSSTGTYYLRVYPYRLVESYITYRIALSTSTDSVDANSGIYKSQDIITKQAIKISIPSTLSTAVKYQYTSSSTAEIQAYNIVSSQKIVLSQSSPTCLPAQAGYSLVYAFVIKDSISLATSLNGYNITFYYDPSINCSKETANNTVNENTSSTSTTSEIGIAVGCAVAGVVIVGIIVFFCIRRCRKMQEQPYVKKNGSQPNQIVAQGNNSFNNLNINLQISCSICLDQSCNTKLICGHVFHKTCIQEWMKRNNQCPLCRGVFSKSKMQIKKNSII